MKSAEFNCCWNTDVQKSDVTPRGPKQLICKISFMVCSPNKWPSVPVSFWSAVVLTAYTVLKNIQSSNEGSFTGYSLV